MMQREKDNSTVLPGTLKPLTPVASIFVISSGDRLRKPIRLKIQKGKTIYLTRPYEGKARSVSGAVDVDNLYGQQTSLNFLQSYKGSPKKGYAVS